MAPSSPGVVGVVMFADCGCEVVWLRVLLLRVGRVVGGPSSGPTLPHWPIKLDLISPDAPFLRGADLMLVADCAPFARAELREEFTSHTAVMIGCPKSDPYQSAAARLTEILRRANARSLTVVHMEVPCCSGYWHMAQEALTAAESPLALRRMVVGVRGEASTETAS